MCSKTKAHLERRPERHRLSSPSAGAPASAAAAAAMAPSPPTAFAAKYDGEIEGVRAREFYKQVDTHASPAIAY